MCSTLSRETEGLGPMKSSNRYNYTVLNPTEYFILEDEESKIKTSSSQEEVF